MDELEKILDEAVRRFENGDSMEQIRSFLSRNRVDAVEALLQEVAARVGISRDTLLFDTGDSYGKTRRKRPENTWAVMTGALLGVFSQIRRDEARLRKEPRTNGQMAGVSFRKSFGPKFKRATTLKAKAKVLNEEIRRTIERVIENKARRRYNHAANVYAATESRNVRLELQRQSKRDSGFQWVFIPVTSHGHLDECFGIQNKWYRIGQVPKLPFHVRCLHRYQYFKRLPSNVDSSQFGPTNITKEEQKEFRNEAARLETKRKQKARKSR